MNNGNIILIQISKSKDSYNTREQLILVLVTQRQAKKLYMKKEKHAQMLCMYGTRLINSTMLLLLLTIAAYFFTKSQPKAFLENLAINFH